MEQKKNVSFVELKNLRPLDELCSLTFELLDNESFVWSNELTLGLGRYESRAVECLDILDCYWIIVYLAE